jgi:hypothetical protein
MNPFERGKFFALSHNTVKRGATSKSVDSGLFEFFGRCIQPTGEARYLLQVET